MELLTAMIHTMQRGWMLCMNDLLNCYVYVIQIF